MVSPSENRRHQWNPSSTDRVVFKGNSYRDFVLFPNVASLICGSPYDVLYPLLLRYMPMVCVKRGALPTLKIVSFPALIMVAFISVIIRI